MMLESLFHMITPSILDSNTTPNHPDSIPTLASSSTSSSCSTSSLPPLPIQDSTRSFAGSEYKRQDLKRPLPPLSPRGLVEERDELYQNVEVVAFLHRRTNSSGSQRKKHAQLPQQRNVMVSHQRHYSDESIDVMLWQLSEDEDDDDDGSLDQRDDSDDDQLIGLEYILDQESDCEWIEPSS